MTPAEIQFERNYRIAKRIAITCDDGLDGTPQQNRIARQEADAFESDLSLQELTARVFNTSRFSK